RHTAETVTYLVVEAGTWMLPDGSLLEAGTVDSSRLSSQGFERVTFDAEFDDTPVVLSQVQTLNGGDFVTTRQRPADADGVELTMQEEEANNDGSHAVETLGWVAIEAGAGTSGGIGWLAGSASGVTDEGATVALGDGVADDAHVLATLASFAGSDPAWARGDGNTGTGFDVSVEEDTSRDDETDHTAERIDYIAFDGAGTLYTAPLEQVAETGVLALTNVAQTVTLAQSYESPV
ncbi:MAG: calcium-binding protein, partial [Pseudomonadota bacterium]